MIVCFGDSIAYGQHLDNPVLQAWPHLLEYGAEVFAAGVPGDTTRLALERFPAHVQTVAGKGDIVVIQFGHNDCNRWDTDRGLPRVSPRAYEANLTEMIDRARTFDITPVLCTLTPSHRSPEHAQDVATYDRILRRVADNEHVPLADVAAAFGAPGLVMDDGLHLTIEGHCLYAKTVQATLDRMTRG